MLATVGTLDPAVREPVSTISQPVDAGFSTGIIDEQDPIPPVALQHNLGSSSVLDVAIDLYNGSFVGTRQIGSRREIRRINH